MLLTMPLKVLLIVLVVWTTSVTVLLGAEPQTAVWIDQLIEQMQKQRDMATHPLVREGYESYLQHLQHMRNANAAGNVDAVRAGVVSLIRMLALRDNMISESSAHKLLQSIAMSAPVYLLNLNAETEAQLLRIRDEEMETSSRDESSRDGSNATATSVDKWRSAWAEGTVLSETFAILFIIGACMILVFSSVRVAQFKDESSTSTLPAHADETSETAQSHAHLEGAA